MNIKFSILAAILCLASSMLQAAPRPGDVAPGDDWQVAPFDYKFGNHIDTHTQLRLIVPKGVPNKLIGSFYIIFTGETDPLSGLPIARHPRGLVLHDDGSIKHDEACGESPVVCEVGWYMDGKPGAAKFVSHSGVNRDDHPLWLTNRSPGSNQDSGMSIPQPGSFTHFHWITPSGNDPRISTVPAACDEQMAGKLEGDVIEAADVDVSGAIKVMDLPDVDATAGWTGQKVHSGLAETSEPLAVASAENVVCPGWYLQINARQDFAFQHGGEIIPVHRGIDNASHLNLLTNYAIIPGLTTTRPGGAGH